MENVIVYIQSRKKNVFQPPQGILNSPSTDKSLPDDAGVRVHETVDTPLPVVALLGRTPFTTMVSAAGGGITRHGSIALNRWRMDPTRDDYGQWCYVRDLRTDRVWSTTHQPTGVAADTYEVTMALHSVTFRRRDGDIETTTEVVVVPGEPAESRRVTVVNNSDTAARLELTSYQEIVLATTVSDRGHRAFGNLFVQTEWVPELSSLLAMRRPRSKNDDPLWCGHTVASAAALESVTCETDRARFQGRGRGARNPVVMDTPGDLTNTVGAVLDPVFAIRVVISVPAGGSASVVFSTFGALDREDALRLAGRLSDVDLASTSLYEAVVDAQAEVIALGIAARDAASNQVVASEMIYGGRAGYDTTARRGDLLAAGLTGEFPVFLSDPEDHDERIIRSLTLHRYWRVKGLVSDLVLGCRSTDRAGEVSAVVQEHLAALDETAMLGAPGGVFVLAPESLPAATWRLLGSIARVR